MAGGSWGEVACATDRIGLPNNILSVSTQKDSAGVVSQHTPAIAAINSGGGGYVSIDFQLPEINQPFYWTVIGN
jgi:hypothetical protein